MVRIDLLSKPVLRHLVPGCCTVQYKPLNICTVYSGWNNCSKHSVCQTSRRKSCSGLNFAWKEGVLVFKFLGDTVFWHFLIPAKMNELDHFRRFHSKQMKVSKMLQFQSIFHCYNSQELRRKLRMKIALMILFSVFFLFLLLFGLYGQCDCILIIL